MSQNDKYVRLIQEIYQLLKIKILKEKKIIQKRKIFVENHFKISGWWIEQDFQTFEICFHKSKYVDEVQLTISEIPYNIEEESKKDEYDLYSYYAPYGPLETRWLIEESLHDDFGPAWNDPEFSFYIPKFLINTFNSEFITNYIYDKYFPSTDLSNGAILQSNLSYFRLYQSLDEKLEELKSEISRLRKNKNEPNKGTILGKFFYFLGFETLIIDYLKKIEKFKILSSISNPDIIAYSLYTKELLIVEQKPSFNNQTFHKMSLIGPMFDVFKFLGDKDEWRIIHILIGSVAEVLKSQVTEIGTGKEVIVISHDKFEEFVSKYLKEMKLLRKPISDLKLKRVYNIFQKLFLSGNLEPKYIT